MSEQAAELVQRFRDYLSREGLKCTRQREAIASVVFSSEGHLTLNDIHVRAQQVQPSVGFATVYRTMKLLSEAGLATQHRFDDGQSRFERADEDHHDHIICSRCGRIVEFEAPEIEVRQERIALGLGFKVVSHRHEIYGECMLPCRYGEEPSA
ncbi:MAG: transcriptional repressor [Deltaproteobacteria bacterium]|nr:MAG: transcriptional repressor [Deltaproteobacteria bacterium]